MDLATTDDEIARALGRDAGRMLAADPDRLQAWTRRWLDPRAGEPGWAWVAAGLDDATQARLGRAMPIRE
jgi:hypothetical protein